MITGEKAIEGSSLARMNCKFCGHETLFKKLRCIMCGRKYRFVLPLPNMTKLRKTFDGISADGTRRRRKVQQP